MGFLILDSVIVVLEDHTCLFNLKISTDTQIHIWFHMLESVIL